MEYMRIRLIPLRRNVMNIMFVFIVSRLTSLLQDLRRRTSERREVFNLLDYAVSAVELVNNRMTWDGDYEFT
jgi:hypothetical protein